MSGSRNILLVGEGREALALLGALQMVGATVERTESFEEGSNIIKRTQPDALVIVLPVTWERAISFVKEVRVTVNDLCLPYHKKCLTSGAEATSLSSRL